MVFKVETAREERGKMINHIHIFSHFTFLLNKKTAAKQNTRKQSNVTMWNIKKLH